MGANWYLMLRALHIISMNFDLNKWAKSWRMTIIVSSERVSNKWKRLGWQPTL